VSCRLDPAPDRDRSYVTLEDLVIHEVDVGIGGHTSMHHLAIRQNHIYNTGSHDGTGEGMCIGYKNATCVISDSTLANHAGRAPR
jgi:hypothetical protein